MYGLYRQIKYLIMSKKYSDSLEYFFPFEVKESNGVIIIDLGRGHELGNFF